MNSQNYIEILKEIKADIIKSRYLLAKIANREMLKLYFNVGARISEKVAAEKWGSKTIQKLSDDLQIELKGLRGFSYGSLRKMRWFYEEWKDYFYINKPNNQFCSLPKSKIDKSIIEFDKYTNKLQNNQISPLQTSKFEDAFEQISFTAHYEIIAKTKKIEERVFYIAKTATEFWTVETLKHKLANKLFDKHPQLPNNFENVLNEKQTKQALKAFRDNYLFNFIRISEEDQDDEKVLENEIVNNIKKFIMSLGADFTFIANQFRILVDDDEYFIDLLFFNRSLQALVAIELKTGKFKPEYLGKMNFYLSALDEYVKQKHENPSIGIILCKEKKNKTVEFTFRDFNKAMGVATYKTSKALPEQFKNKLPDAETLKLLMDKDYGKKT